MRSSLPLAGALFFLGALATGLGASCGDDVVLRQLCASDQACIDDHDGNPNWFCHDRGQCACKNDDACLENEHCNPIAADGKKGGDGECHPDQLCELNADCRPNESCGQDGVCRTGCVDDLQCELGNVCDLESNVCVAGCWTDGDCNLKEGCLCKDDEGKPTRFCECEAEGHIGCEIGVCNDTICPGKEYCEYGELCNPSFEDPSGPKHCEEDDRGEYCKSCSRQAGDQYSLCGTAGPDFCLIDSSDPARQATFCGVDCDQDQECPNGYGCNDILVLTQQTCGGDPQCNPSPGAESCAQDEDCPAGGRCAGGRCAGRCVGNEGGTSGFCTCVADEDCPEDTCGSDNRCSITRRSCITDESCQILCVNDGNIGYCRIGRNCTPADGLTCSEIRAASSNK